MKTLCCSVMIAILVLAAAIPVMAQYESLEKGSQLRIRSQAAEGMPVMVTNGYLDEMCLDYIILVDGFYNETIIIKDQITKVEYLKSAKRHTLAGLMIGVLVGATTGAMIGQMAKPKSTGDLIKDTYVAPIAKATATASMVLLGSAAGGVIGFAIGAGSGSEEWVVVPPVHPEAPVAAAGIAALATPRFGVRINF